MKKLSTEEILKQSKKAIEFGRRMNKFRNDFYFSKGRNVVVDVVVNDGRSAV